MHEIIKGFVSGNGYGWGNTAHEVNNIISSTNERVQHHDFKENVGMSANDAGAETFSITDKNLTQSQSVFIMNSPNVDSVTGPADEIRTRNRIEESGKGGIHTTAGELAKEMAGLHENSPPRPTNDYYRNQSFYHNGNLIQPRAQEDGIVLPSGRIIQGDADYIPPEKDEDFWKGSVFEEK